MDIELNKGESMGIFKKSKALYYDKMNLISNVTITEEKVHFDLNYSGIDVKPEKIPGLLADMMQLYAHVKPILDAESLARIEQAKKHNEVNDTSEIDEKIDLSEIPF